MTAKRRRAQRGAALVSAMFALIVLLLLGVSGAQLALHGEKAARAQRDRNMAFQAAEEALMDAENDLEGSLAFPGRSASFAPDSALGFANGCAIGAANPQLGLCRRADDGQTPVWLAVDLTDDAPATTRSVPYGTFTGAAMHTGEGTLPFRRPRYIIELLPYAQAGQDAAGKPNYFYRVTAVGFGAYPDSQVVLQSYYRKQSAGRGRK